MDNIEQQIVQLVQAASQGDKDANQQIEQILQAAQKGDKQAIQIAQMIQQVIETMKKQSGVKARLGAKLGYINKLKGNCPDGQESYYFKEGGIMKKGCKPCMAEKGKKIKKENAIDAFRAGCKTKKK